jgi:hypothetical protein
MKSRVGTKRRKRNLDVDRQELLQLLSPLLPILLLLLRPSSTLIPIPIRRGCYPLLISPPTVGAQAGTPAALLALAETQVELKLKLKLELVHAFGVCAAYYYYFCVCVFGFAWDEG